MEYNVSVVGFGDNVVDIYTHSNKQYPGGNCVNFAVYAKMFGAKRSAYMGYFGTDVNADHVIEALHNEKIETVKCKKISGENGYSRCKLENGDRVFLDYNEGGVRSRHIYELDEFDIEYLKQFDLVHCGNYCYMESQLPKIKEANIPLSFDFSDDSTEEYYMQIAPLVTYAFCSYDGTDEEVKKHLKISIAGVQEGDFTFVMGFPGRNWRYMISDEVEERMQTTNFMRQHVRGARQKVLMEQMLKDPAVRIHYASKYASSANYWKNAIGMNEGLVRLKVLDTKRKQQEELLARGREKGDDSYQKAFDEIRSIVAHRRDALYHQQALNEALVTALDFMRLPSTTEMVTALKPKDKEQIKTATENLKQAGEKYFASVPFPEVERMVAKTMLQTYASYIPEEQRINIFEIINSRFKGNIDSFVDACFEYSIFGNPKNFEKFIKKPSLYKIGHDWMVLFKYSITD